VNKALLLLAITSTLTGCVPTVILNSGSFSTPTLDTPTTSELGDAIYILEDIIYKNAIRIEKLPNEQLFLGRYNYKVGDIIPENGENKIEKIYSFYNEVYHDRGMNYRSENFTKHGMFGVVVNKETNKAYPSEGITNKPQVIKVDGLEVSPAKYIVNDCDKCFKKEFIYNGKANNNLKFVYREYIHDMARPAFSQELQYDLNESNIIGFKGLRIEVLKSTNTNIEYKVLNDIN